MSPADVEVLLYDLVFSYIVTLLNLEEKGRIRTKIEIYTRRKLTWFPLQVVTKPFKIRLLNFNKGLFRNTDEIQVFVSFL